ncbi:hypothetical protein BC826DRAFT_1055659, partial [Russula brevipes]
MQFHLADGVFGRGTVCIPSHIRHTLSFLQTRSCMPSANTTKRAPSSAPTQHTAYSKS